MNKSYGQLGWQEFHRNRKNILDEFDKILEQTANRPVKTAHGTGVEAYLRKWLENFLPKKYGVTSGYIIPTLYESTGPIYHFDIIIYDKLNAPVLWTEGNEDQSEQGKYRAIPAKHVIAVYEVKARLNLKNAKDVVSKLNQISPFADQLNDLFSCGVIFVELKEEDVNSRSILNELHKGHEIIGFTGGMVLRYENDDDITGLISLNRVYAKSDNNNKQKKLPLVKPIDTLKINLTEEGSLQLPGDGSGAIMVATSDTNWSVSKLFHTNYYDQDILIDLSWSRTFFSEFCIQLLSVLEGVPRSNIDKDSFGRIYDHIDSVETPIQSNQPESGHPFLKVSCVQIRDSNEFCQITEKDGLLQVKHSLKYENIGDIPAIVSDDMYKSEITIPAGGKAGRDQEFILKPEKNKTLEEMKEILSKGITYPYRVVYCSDKAKKDFVAIELKLRLSDSKVEIVE